MINKRKTGKTVLSALIAVIIFVCAVVPAANNFIAYRIKKDLERCPLPEGAELCASVSAAGKLDGNGNGMQYLGAILIRSHSNLQDIRSHYTKFRTGPWDHLVREQRGNRVDIIEHQDISFDILMYENDTYYIVYTWGTAVSDFLVFADIRGH